MTLGGRTDGWGARRQVYVVQVFADGGRFGEGGGDLHESSADVTFREVDLEHSRQEASPLHTEPALGASPGSPQAQSRVTVHTPQQENPTGQR